MKLIPYVVKQGDYVAKLAARFGFDADATWNDAKNDDLRKAGRTPDVLHPGDVIYIPQAAADFKPLTPGTDNQFTAHVPRVSLTLTFHDATGAPVANTKVEYRGLPPSSSTTERPEKTDGSGTLVVDVPVATTAFVVELPEKGVIREMLVGHMDPVCEPSGQLKRLQHLGYGMSPLLALGEQLCIVDLDHPEHLRLQLIAFQLDHDLEPTGSADDKTCDALVAKHGS